MKVYLLEKENCYDVLVFSDKEAAVKAMTEFVKETKRAAIIRIFESQNDNSKPFEQVEYLSSLD